MTRSWLFILCVVFTVTFIACTESRPGPPPLNNKSKGSGWKVAPGPGPNMSIDPRYDTSK